MLNVCFNASESTLLKLGLPNERSTYDHDGLDLGHIHPSDFKKAREEWICNVYALCSGKEKMQMIKDAFERHEDILKAAERDKELRIWYASNPASMCGLFYLIHSLRGVCCKIYLVEMPSHIGHLPEHHDRSWTEAEPDDIQRCLKYQRSIGELERKSYEQAWELLADENAELRVRSNGKITSVPVDHLDDEILSHAPIDEDFKFGNLVGYAMRSPHYLYPHFIAQRMEAMISNGKLTLVKRSDDPEYNDAHTILRARRP